MGTIKYRVDTNSDWATIPAVVGPKPVKGVDYYTDTDKQEIINSVIANIEGVDIDLTGYATKEYVQEQINAIPEPDFSAYALKTELPKIPENISAFTNDKGYTTPNEVTQIVNNVLGVIENGSY